MYYWYGHYWMVYVVFMVFNHSFITNLIIFVYAILYTRFSGFAFSESELVVQKASILNIKRFYVKKEKVLGMAISQHPFLERSQLANFQFVIAKGSSQQNIGLKFSEVDNVLKLKNWYMKGDTHEVL